MTQKPQTRMMVQKLPDVNLGYKAKPNEEKHDKKQPAVDHATAGLYHIRDPGRLQGRNWKAAQATEPECQGRVQFHARNPAAPQNFHPRRPVNPRPKPPPTHER